MNDLRARAERLRMNVCEKYDLDVQARHLHDRLDRDIYTLDSGGAGVPVVFFHGGGADAGQWIPLAARVRATGRRVVLVDRPGHGLSYPIEYGSIDYRRAAADFVEDVLDALWDGPVDVVANSMGGFFSLVLALRRPEMFRKLVLLGAPAGVDEWIPYPLRLLGFKPLNRLLFWQSRSWDTEEYRDMFGDLIVTKPDELDDDMLEMSVAMAQVPGYETAWRTLLEECVSLTGFRHMIREEVAELDIPVRFIWGSDDVFAPPSSGRDLARRMPDATIDVVEGAGHGPWFDELDECARLVLDALDEATPRRTAA